MTKHNMRQGDVILVEADVSPESLVEVKAEPVLAYGEVTGHAHRLHGSCALMADGPMTADEVAAFARTGAKKPKLYVVARNDSVALRHEEHAPLILKQGKVYEVRRQREWSDANEPIAVAD